MFYMWDPTMMILLPALLLTGYAQLKINSTYNKYSQIPSKRGLTGADVARYILNMNGLHDIPIERVGGHLSDHYDPRTRVVRLSPDVYHGTSLAALGVAAHEVGHAVQHDTGYLPLYVRNTIIPVTQFGSYAAVPLFFIGLFMSSEALISFGIMLFAAIVFFQLVTLPVEFNASRRAMEAIEGCGILTQDEQRGARKTLTAAAMTYVAATATALAQLLRLVLLFGGRRRRD